MRAMLSRARPHVSDESTTRFQLAHLQVAIAATMWGSWSIFLRPAKVDSRWSATIMLAVVAVATSPLLLRKSARGPRERTSRDWAWIALLGVSDALNAFLFFAAMEQGSIAVAVLSLYLAPVLVAAFGPTFLRTRRSPRSIPLAVVALFGLALVLEPWKLDASHGSVVLCALLGAGSAVFYASNVLITKRIGARFTAEEQLVYHSVPAAALVASLAIAQHAPLPTRTGFAIVAAASVLVGATAGLLFLYGLRRIPAEHAGILTFLEPLTAVAVAWIWWGEQPGIAAAFGGALVVFAGVLSVRDTPPPEGVTSA
jgi:drug/metabolite transporter (DMT)-like permease